MELAGVRRRVDQADLAAIRSLAAAAGGTTGHAPLSEARWLELEREGRAPGSVPGFAALVVPVTPGCASPGQGGLGTAGADLAAYGQLRQGPLSWDLEVVARPGPGAPARRTAVVRQALELVGEAGGGPLQWFVPMATGDDDGLAASLGLEQGRTLIHLRRPLPLEPSLAAAAGKVSVRPFLPGADEEAWLRVNNAAFAAHPDQGGWDEATLSEHEDQPWFDPAGLLMAEDDGRLVGFCWTKIMPDEPAVGEIYVIGVAPDSQGAGLGAALLAAGCHHLAARGARTVVLYVDGDNEPARRLYRSAGFVEDHRDVFYTGRVEPSWPEDPR